MGVPYLTEFEAICRAVNGFEDGDLLTACEIRESLSHLAARLQAYPELARLADRLAGISEPLVNGSTYDSIQTELTRGLDLLGLALEHTETPDGGSGSDTEDGITFLQDHLEDIERFLAETSGSVSGTAPESGPGSAPKDSSSRSTASARSKPDREVRPDTAPDAWDMGAVNREALEIFIHDANERLVQVQAHILALEEDYDANRALINDVFRAFHTIKGEAGFLHLPRIGELAHNLETLLDMLRSSEYAFDGETAEILFSGVDALSAMIGQLESGGDGAAGTVEIDPLLGRITEWLERKRPLLGRILVNEGKVQPEEIERLVKDQAETGFSKKLGELAVESGRLTPEELEASLLTQRLAGARRKTEEAGRHESADTFINVKASYINELTDMIQELMIAENQLSGEQIQSVRKITRKIQTVAMRLRTVKLKTLFVKLKRLVRDLSQKLARPTALEITGEELECDRNLVEALEEPLLHIIRNSIDHGIESSGERILAGKPETGRIVIRAERKGNRLTVSIRDDGRGLDRNKIIGKAVARGIVQADEAERMPERKVYELILLPGFSTAEQVSEVSGRGVGMDVVNQMVAASRGRIRIESEPGSYTEIELSFPLNTAVIDGMVVELGPYRLVVPVSEVVECVELSDSIRHGIRGNTMVLDIRGELIQVLTIREALEGAESELTGDRQIAMIVMNEGTKYAILVDKVLEKTEVAIKPLGKKFKTLKVISAATIFSGGKIGFILDIDELVHGGDHHEA
jgi:two-component system chemotaxis sensor kinase CheA